MRLLGLLLTVGVMALIFAYYLETGGFSLQRQVDQYQNVNNQVDRVKEDINKYNGIINTYDHKLNVETK